MSPVLREYLRAAAKHVYLLTIGGVGFVLTLVSLAAPTAVRVVGIALLVVGVFGAQFLAWRDMREERERARGERAESERRAGEREAALLAKLDVREKRKAIRESLGEFFAQGEDVRAWIVRGGDPVGKVHTGDGIISFYSDPKDKDDETLRGSLERAAEWEEQVAAFLGQYLGASYVALFRSQVGTVAHEPPKLGDKLHADAWTMVDSRLQVLATIIKEAGEDLIGT